MEIIARALLEQEYPQQPDNEQRTRRDAEHEIRDLQPARRGQRQLGRISTNSIATADTSVKAQRWWRKANSVDMGEVPVKLARQFAADGPIKLRKLVSEQRAQKLLHLRNVDLAVAERQIRSV